MVKKYKGLPLDEWVEKNHLEKLRLDIKVSISFLIGDALLEDGPEGYVNSAIDDLTRIILISIRDNLS